MKRIIPLLRIIAFLILPVGLVVGFAAFLTLPRLVEFSPADAGVNVPASAALRLRFSRAMNTAEVQERIRTDPPSPGEFSWEGSTLIFKPDEPWPAGAQVRVELLHGARPAQFPSLPMQSGHTWSFNVRQPRAAFLFPSNGPANIYLHDPLTNSDHPLTNEAGGVLDFSVTPGGDALLYSAANPQGGSDLYRLDLAAQFEAAAPDGNPIPAAGALILACSPAYCRSPSISPDGSTLAYERAEPVGTGGGADPQIWWMPLEPPGQPTAVSEPADSAVMPTWSPDGRLTYYNSRLQTFVIFQPEDNEEIRLENAAGKPGDWQPDGAAFVAPDILVLNVNYSETIREDLEQLTVHHLMRYAPVGAAFTDLSREEGIEDLSPIFSPDGRFFAFARRFLDAFRWTPGRQLWLMDAETLNARPLSDDPDYNHFDFAWTADSRRLAYVRFNERLLTESPEIWVLDLGSGTSEQIVSGGYAPQWIP